MADRYWVGGTANWDATAGSKWSLTSGGAGGQAKPSSSDDVFFDANSGAGTTTITVTASINAFDATGYTGTLTLTQELRPRSDTTLGSGMTLNGTQELTIQGDCNLTTNGITLTRGLRIGSTTNLSIFGTTTLQDTLTLSNSLTISSGSFDANNQDITGTSFAINSTTSVARALTMGSGTWTLSSNTNVWNIIDPTNATLASGTSNIILTGGSMVFKGGDFTYFGLFFQRGTGNNPGSIQVQDSNTFNTFSDTGSKAHDLTFVAGTTNTFGSFRVSGFEGATITIESPTAATHTLSMSSGITRHDNLNVSYSIATGGASWYAGSNSTDSGNNTGWIFTDDPTVTGKPPSMSVNQTAKPVITAEATAKPNLSVEATPAPVMTT